MHSARHPEEAARLEALRRLEPPLEPAENSDLEPELQELATLAAEISETPIAGISLVGEDEQWFAARFGTEADRCARDLSLCTHAILAEEIFEVSDAQADERFCELPGIKAGTRFYTAVPLRSEDRLPVGVLCVADVQPRRLTDRQKQALKTLARQAMHALELRAERKKLERERLELQATLRRAEVATWRQDVATGVIYGNDLLYRLYGVDGPRPVEDLRNAVHPDDWPRIAAANQYSQRTGGRYEAEYRVRDSEGKERWVLARGDAERGPDGKLIALRGIVIDITDRKAVERESREQGELLRRIMECSRDSIEIADLNGNLLSINDIGMEVLGLSSSEQVIGRHWPSLFEGEWVDLTEQAIQGARTGHPERLETMSRGRWWEITVSPMLGSDGRPESLLIVSRDISERREAEHAIAEERAQRDRVMDTAQVATWHWDAELDHFASNHLMRQYFGIPEAAAHQATLFDYLKAIHPEDRARVSEAIAGALESGDAYESEFRAIDALGQQRWVLMRGNPSVESRRTAGISSSLSGALVDVTARRQAEAEVEAGRRWLDATLATAGVATFDWDMASNRLRGNAMLDRFFGLKGAGGEGLLLGDLLNSIYEPDRPRLLAALDAARRTGGRYETEFRTELPDGAIRWTLIRGETVLDEAGGVVRMSGIALDVTEQNEARRQLDAERQEFRRLLDEVPAHIVTLRGPDLRYDFANRSFLQFLGRELDFLGKPAGEAWPVPDDHIAMLKRIFETGETFYGHEAPVPYPTAPDRIGFFDFIFQPLRDLQNRVQGIFVHSSDVTEKVLARRSLAESEERFRIVAQATRDAVWDWDLRTDAVWWNEGVTDLFGFERSEVEQSRDWWLEHVHPDDRDRVVRSIRDCIARGETYWRQEYRFFNARGETMIVDDHGFAVFGEEGKTIRLVGAMVDVTEDRRNVASLAFQRRLNEVLTDLRSPLEVVHKAPEIIGKHFLASRAVWGVVDLDGETVRLMGEWTAGQRPAVPAEYPLSALGEHAVADLREGRAVLWRNLEEVSSELRARAETANVQASVIVPVSRDGRLTGLLHIHDSKPRDWREDEVQLLQQVAFRVQSSLGRAQAETELLEAKAGLESAVEARTAELRASVEEAESFNYAISHDLRAPLRAIAVTSRVLLEEVGNRLDEEHRELLDRQAKNATRLGVLIDQLLRLSRLARVEVTRSTLDMTSLVQGVVEELERAGLSRECQIDVAEGMVGEGDAALVRLVVQNLLENACKFSPEGGAVQVRQEGNVFSVADKGIGFDMRYATKLFAPFERLVREEEFPGTGIGLANVERIVRRHGGRVWAESEPGKGATFFFTLGPD